MCEMAYFAVPAINMVIAGCRISVSSRFVWISIFFCELIVVYTLVVSWVFRKARSAERVPVRDLYVVVGMWSYCNRSVLSSVVVVVRRIAGCLVIGKYV